MASIDPEIVTVLKQNRATEKEFTAWCLAHGLTRFATYPEVNQWQFVADFLEERGISRNAVPTPALSRSRHPSVGSNHTVLSGITRDVVTRAARDEAARSGRCGCTWERLCSGHAAIRNRQVG